MALAVTPDHLRHLAERTRPVTLAREQVLPVLPALATLLPGGALRRGSTVAVGGEAATSLALALTAAPSADGSWVAVVGLPSLGVAAAGELGLSLDRLVLVREPPTSSWGAVVAALVGAFDVVLLGPAHRVHPADGRRLVARSRERGSVLVAIASAGAGSGRGGLPADVRLTASGARWHGLGAGHGHLQARVVTVEVGGRRDADRPRRAALWLPGPHGEVAPYEHSQPFAGTTGTVTPLRRRTG